MRYVQKLKIPDFFNDDIKGFKSWDDYEFDENTKQKRRNLRQHILEKEQNNLCIYCECYLDVDNSHIEHLKPKEKYKSLTFEYNNLAVSCEGLCLKGDSTDKKRHRCGHKKDNLFDESKFLNPTVVENIRDYFGYMESKKDCFEIISSNKDKIKSAYMINELLHLNDGSTPKARGNALNSFRKALSKIKDKKERDEKFYSLLDRRFAFVSFIRFFYNK